MRFEDFKDYASLRRMTRNPLDAIRFRKNKSQCPELCLEFRNQPKLYMRGGRADYHVFHRIFLRDEYKLEPILAKRLGNVIDLGGNVGLFTARVAPYAEKVVVCEPVPENFERLEKNLSNFDNVVRKQIAVSDREKDIEIFMLSEDRHSGAFSAHREEQGNLLREESITIPAVSLEQLMATQEMATVDLLKIDIEGAEYEVIYAAENILPRINRIHGEYHNVDASDPRTRIDNFSAFLRGAGYEVEVQPHRHLENHGLFFAARPGH